RDRAAHRAPAADDRRLRLSLRRRRDAAGRHRRDQADARRGRAENDGNGRGSVRQTCHAELRLGVTELGLLARFIHLSSSILVLGSTAVLLLAGRSDRRTALAWESGVVALTRGLVWLAIAAGGVVLAHQTATLESRAAAALEPLALARVAFETRFGQIWLVRHGVLLLLGAFVMFRLDLRRSLDWRAARGEALLLAALGLGGPVAAGPSAAVEPSAITAIAADVGRLLAAGVWAGALPAVALLLRAASREAGADGRPYAVVATRRFSRAALVLVVILLGTGV